jgi:5'-nucleotidase
MSLVYDDGEAHFDSAAEAAMVIVRKLREDPLPADTILNINVPNLPWEKIKGFEVTRLGHRHRAEPAIEVEDPRGRKLYWIGPAGPEQDAGPGTDFNAVKRGYVSITPIHVDLTRYQALEQVASWVNAVEKKPADAVEVVSE